MSQRATMAAASPVWALQGEGLTLELGGREVLHGIDLGLAAGRWTSIVGPNGAGKSTLLRALAGLSPVRGKVQLLGRDLAQWSSRERAQQLAWLGQNEISAQDLSVYDVVMLGRMPHQPWLSAPSEVDHAAVRQAMAQTHVAAWSSRSLGSLSGGERQRVLLARALAVQAPVVLMDEPLVNLDPPHQTDWLETVQALVASGVTVISVLHEISMALQSQDMLILAEGRVVHHGASSDVATHAALEAVFDQRIQVRAIDGHWVALPRLR